MSHPFFLCGVVHLLPLPGGPRPSPGIDLVIERARHDAAVLATAGFDGLIVENLGDAPFRKSGVDPHVVAIMTRIVGIIRSERPGLQLGVNVLRNDGRAALAIASAGLADFIRINVLIGATWTDQGLIEGEAHELLRYRRELGLDTRVSIAADLLVKHGIPAGLSDRKELAKETVLRGGADRLILSGRATGAPTDLAAFEEVRQALPGTPLWIGSGLTESQAPEARRLTDGAIVGTSIHEEGDLRRPLCARRARQLRRLLGG